MPRSRRRSWGDAGRSSTRLQPTSHDLACQARPESQAWSQIPGLPAPHKRSRFGHKSVRSPKSGLAVRGGTPSDGLMAAPRLERYTTVARLRIESRGRAGRHRFALGAADARGSAVPSMRAAPGGDCLSNGSDAAWPRLNGPRPLSSSHNMHYRAHGRKPCKSRRRTELPVLSVHRASHRLTQARVSSQAR